jgi:Putative prokaryotic signal transducing protein
MTNAWHVLVTYASGFEADLAIARLESAEIPAMRDSNDTVGIFGPGFQGATARGVSVLVPEAFVEEARAVLVDVETTDVVEDEPLGG